jgi:hypothetical protein
MGSESKEKVCFEMANDLRGKWYIPNSIFFVCHLQFIKKELQTSKKNCTKLFLVFFVQKVTKKVDGIILSGYLQIKVFP